MSAPDPLAANPGSPDGMVAAIARRETPEPWREAAAERVAELIRSGSTFAWFGGPEQRAFEREFAEFVEAKFAVMCSSGTCALELALAAKGVGPGTTVGVPAFCWFTSVTSILRTGAKPFFLRVDPRTLQIDVESAVEDLPQNSVLLNVHNIGRAIDLTDLMLRRPDVRIIEDASEGQSTRLHGRHVGRQGSIATWSFTTDHNVVHVASTGGMVTTDDADLAAVARRLAHYGKPSRLEDSRHGLNPPPERLGLNGMTSEIEAVVGRATLLSAEEGWARRRRTGRALHDGLAALGLSVPDDPPGCDTNFYDTVFLVPLELAGKRELLFRRLVAAKVSAWTYHSPLSFDWLRTGLHSRGWWDQRLEGIAKTDGPLGQRLMGIKPPRELDDIGAILGAVERVLAAPTVEVSE